MRPRAVLFDVYGTLLACHPRRDPEPGWRQVAGRFGLNPPGSIRAARDAEIARRHAAADRPHPEVDLREVWQAVFPELADDKDDKTDAFAVAMELALHELAEMPGARAAIRRAEAAGCRLGIVSNAQQSSRDLLALLLGAEFDSIDPRLCAFSFEHGFSKPDPALFRIPLDALAAAGIAADEILMIGDRHDNDIEPARALGLRSLHFGVELRGWDQWNP